MRAPLGTRIHLCPAASHGHEVPTRTPVVPVGTHPSKPLYPPWAHSPFMPQMSQQSPWMQRACHHPSDPPLCVHTLSLLCSLIYPLLCYCSGPQTPALCSGPPAGNGLWGRDGAVPAPRRQDPALGPHSHLDAAVAPVGHDDVAIGVDSHPCGGVELPVPLPVRPELEEELTVCVVHLGMRVSVAAGTGPVAQWDGHGTGRAAGTAHRCQAHLHGVVVEIRHHDLVLVVDRHEVGPWGSSAEPRWG